MRLEQIESPRTRIAPRPVVETDNAPCPIAALFRNRDGVRHVQPGSTLFVHGDPANAVYQITSGTVACCTISQEGRRQIFSFARAGAFLGLTEMANWHFTGQAVDHVVLRAIPRERLEAALATDTALQLSVRRYLATEIAGRERLMMRLAYMSSEARLQAFLAEFAATRSTDGFVVLPMTRQDIGDHLGLTLETVSRGFGALRRKGIIQMYGSERFRMADTIQTLAA